MRRISCYRRKLLMLNGERGRNRTYNLLTKIQLALCRSFCSKHQSHQPLTTSLAHTENPLEMLETLAMFSNVQPQLQPHLLNKDHRLRMRLLGMFQRRKSVDRL